MAALDSLESAVERRRDADRDEDELASRIQALGTDRSRLADELDVSLVKTRRLERANRELGDRLDAAIAAIREVLGGAARMRRTAERPHEPHQRHHQRPAIPHGLRGRAGDAADAACGKPAGPGGDLRGKFGEIGDQRLTVMAALTACDELLDANARLEKLEQELASLRDVRVAATDRARATRSQSRMRSHAAAERIEKTTQVFEPYGRGRRRDRVIASSASMRQAEPKRNAAPPLG